jgi:hypothetical protein
MRLRPLNGRTLMPGETNDYYTWHDDFTTFAIAIVPSLKRGRHEFDFAFAKAE